MQTLLISILFVSSFSWTEMYRPSPSNYKKAIIYFGQGGGFTGAETTYALLENGRLFKKNSLNDKDFKLINKLDRKAVDQLFRNYSFLGISAMQLQDPGNLYYFVEHSYKKTNHKLTWGGKSEAPENLKLFYSILNHFIPQS